MNERAPNLQTFAGWAEVAARLRGQPPDAQAEILSALGIHAGWPESDAYWRAVLVEDIALGNTARPDHYREICHAAKVETAPAGPPRIVPSTPAAGAVAPPAPAPIPSAPASQTPSSASPWAGGPGIAATSAPANPPASHPAHTVGFAARPAATSHPPGDFRNRLMTDVNETPAASTGGGPSSGSLLDRMTAGAAEVAAPTADQTSTAGVGSDDARAAMAATEAVRWPLARYAHVTAMCEREPHRQMLIWAEYDITGNHLVRVLKRWRTRFQEDPGLEAEWRRLVEAEQLGG